MGGSYNGVKCSPLTPAKSSLPHYWISSINSATFLAGIISSMSLCSDCCEVIEEDKNMHAKNDTTWHELSVI